MFERGSVGKRLTHRTRRCLILGIGVLEGMTQGELAAILAHEYGHLVNRDTSRDAADPALEEATLEAMNRKTSARDSHPAPCDRIAWTRPIQRTGGSAIDHARPAWSLFSEREQVELAMTEVLRAFVAGHGIGIRGPGHTGRAKVSWN